MFTVRSRILAFLYRVVNYLIFFVTFFYDLGFVSNLIVMESINLGTSATFTNALLFFIALSSALLQKQVSRI
jgi:hypothetical protein